MDWSKAKNVLIFIFLVLNAVLLYTNYDTLSAGKTVSKEILSNTDAILKARGVRLSCKIPTQVEDANLIFESIPLDKAGIAEKLLGSKVDMESILDGKEITSRNKSLIFNNRSFLYKNTEAGNGSHITDVSDAQKRLEKLLKKLNLSFSEYILDKYIKNKDNSYELKYIHKHQGYMIFDDYIKAVVGSSGVTMLEFKYRKVKSFELNERYKPVEAYQVLIEASDIKDTDIKSIDIGFMKEVSDKETINSFDILTWRIVLGNGKELFYSALPR